MKRSRERVDGRRLLVFVLVWLSLTFLAACYDHAIAEWLRALGSETRDRHRDLFRPIEFFGTPYIHILAVLVILALPNARRLLKGYAFAAILPSLVLLTLKTLVGRARPKLNIGAFKFHLLERVRGTLPAERSHDLLSSDTMWQSFPSGETMGAFAFATVLGTYFPRMRYAFWVLAGWVGVARVFLRMHFLSDVIFAAGLGILCVRLVVWWVGRECFTIMPEQLVRDQSEWASTSRDET